MISDLKKRTIFTSFQKTENSTNYHWGIEQEEKLLKDLAEGRGKSYF